MTEKRARGAVGFGKLRHATIKSVNNRAANVVYIETTDGKRYEIGAETNSIGVPILHLSEQERSQRCA